MNFRAKPHKVIKMHCPARLARLAESKRVVEAGHAKPRKEKKLLREEY